MESKFFGTEQTLLITTAPELETAIRNVLYDFLAEKAREDIDSKISRTATCKRLDKTPSSLYRWEQAGKLHPIKIGRTVYYKESEIINIEEGRI